MKTSTKLTQGALFAGALLLTGAANAAIAVTFDPLANNGGLGAVSANAAQNTFTAVGFGSTSLASTLTTTGNSGFVNFTETGTLNVDSWSNPSIASTGLNTDYVISASFTLSGIGSWTNGPVSTLTAVPGAVTFNVTLFADPAGAAPAFTLGTATLDPLGPQVAFAIAFGSVAAGSSGQALTTLNATLDFTPTPGTTGIGGFFQAPDPLNLAFAIGNTGGNTNNTTYSVDALGRVTFATPGTNGGGFGSANATFVNPIPEPGALSLAGIALLGLGFATRRRRSQSGSAA